MKSFTFLLAISLTLVLACKTKQKASTTISDTTTGATKVVVKGSTLGQVSHQFRVKGCSTVVYVKQADQPEPLTLIPRDTLPKSLDVDGLEIYFNYRTLKMKNPEGCTVGIPAELTDISKK
jgi:hypothetical protein